MIPDPLWPRCARCQRPVAAIAWHDDPTGSRIITLRCHGEIEEHQIPLHVLATQRLNIVGVVEVFGPEPQRALTAPGAPPGTASIRDG